MLIMRNFRLRAKRWSAWTAASSRWGRWRATRSSVRSAADPRPEDRRDDPEGRKEGWRRSEGGRERRGAIDERRRKEIGASEFRVREGTLVQDDDQLFTFDFPPTDRQTNRQTDERTDIQRYGQSVGRAISAELRWRRGRLDWTLKCFPPAHRSALQLNKIRLRLELQLPDFSRCMNPKKVESP